MAQDDNTIWDKEPNGAWLALPGVGAVAYGVHALGHHWKKKSDERIQKAKDAMPDMVDPRQEKRFGEMQEQKAQISEMLAGERARIEEEKAAMDDFLDEARTRRRQFQTGEAFDEYVDEAEQMGARRRRAIGKTGGPAGAQLTALAQSDRNSSEMINQILAKGLGEEERITSQIMKGMGMRGNLAAQQSAITQNEIGAMQTQDQLTQSILNRMEQREIDLGMFEASRLYGIDEARRKERMQLLNSVLSLGGDAAVLAAGA